MSHKRSILAQGAALAALLTAVPAHSQQAGTELTEIIVTAQKRAERLQDVPAAVAALPADTLIARNQSRIQDYFVLAPGLNFTAQGNGQTALAVRGVTTGSATNPAVGVVFDDVPFGSSTVLGYGTRLFPDPDPSDLAQIEVLRGPQGTLYGAASIGGLVKVVTKDPSTDGISGRLQAEGSSVAGGEAGYALRGAVNLPASDVLAFRASAYVRRDAGYVDNVLTGQTNVNRARVSGGRVSALWRPTNTVSLKLSALAQDTKGAGSAEVETNADLRPVLGDLAQSAPTGTGGYDIRVRLASASLKADLGAAELNAVTGYGVNRYRGDVDVTTSYGGLAQAIYGAPYVSLANAFKTEKFTQELRLSSSGDHRLDWLVGGFYTHEDTPAVQSLLARDATGGEAGELLTATFPTTFAEYAAFGDLTYHVTDTFDLQAGVRRSRNKQTYAENDTGLVVAQVEADSRDVATTYLLTASYRPSRNLTAYGRFATGYRVGGPNPGATLGFPASYQPDTTRNYELGLKGAMLERRLTYDISLFRIDWKDVQLSLRDPASGFGYFANGAKALSQGLEAAFEASPRRGLRIAGNGAWTKAVLDADLPAGAGQGRDGDRLPMSAAFSGALSVDQDIALGGDLTAFVGASLAFVGSRWSEFVPNASDVRARLPSYTTLDLRTGLRDGVWTLSGFATNLTDARGRVGAGPKRLNGSGGPNDRFFVTYVRPRTIGVSVSRNF